MKIKLEQGKKTCISMPISIKSIDKENYTLTMIASTQDPDRHGDTVIQSGWDIENFMKNPVILNSHNYNDATEVIARAVRTEIVGKGKKSRLEQDWIFAVNENPKAKIIFDLYAGGFLTASSVGFIPKKFKENKDGTVDWWVIEEAELLEVSAVSVPANARALAKAKGIDTDILDADEQENEDEEEKEEEIQEEIKDEEIEETEEDEQAEEVKEEEKPQEEIKEEEEVETPQEKSIKQKTLESLKRFEAKRKERILKVASIVSKLVKDIENDSDVKKHDRRKKINAIIRELTKAK